ncbi:MAG TPA: HDOD domain-containing protein [Methylococcaceae bacterium]|nr:HDOD domain-containing protein [Methylococcaceae bacterium]
MTPGEEDILDAARLEIGRLRTLPAMSTSTQRLLMALQRPDVSVDDLSRLIEDSPSLTARLLGLANAAYFGCRGRVYSVRQAIYQVLGMGVVKSLVLTHVLCDEIDACRCRAFDPRLFWSVSVLTAAFSQQIALRARVTPQLDPSQAYVGGLLVNIGLLAMAHVFPEPMAEALREVESRQKKLSLLLRKRHGLDQYEAGAWLIERWRLPEIYRLAVAQHSSRQIGNRKPCDLARLTRLAHVLAHDCYYQENHCADYADAAGTLGVEIAELELILENMRARREDVLELAKLLGGV